MEPSRERILVPLALGFEEIEAVAIIDVLRRAELDVVVAGLELGPVEGSHGISVVPDAALDELELDSFTAIVLPGGMPGSSNLSADERIVGLVRRLAGEGLTTAAICAAPLVLQAAGVIEGVAITSHPSVRGELTSGVLLERPRVVDSGPILTSQGPGTALEFALALVSRWRGPERAGELRQAMLVVPAGVTWVCQLPGAEGPAPDAGPAGNIPASER
jgi:protein deglycase